MGTYERTKQNALVRSWRSLSRDCSGASEELRVLRVSLILGGMNVEIHGIAFYGCSSDPRPLVSVDSLDGVVAQKDDHVRISHCTVLVGEPARLFAKWWHWREWYLRHVEPNWLRIVLAFCLLVYALWAVLALSGCTTAPGL